MNYYPQRTPTYTIPDGYVKLFDIYYRSDSFRYGLPRIDSYILKIPRYPDTESEAVIHCINRDGAVKIKDILRGTILQMSGVEQARRKLKIYETLFKYFNIPYNDIQDIINNNQLQPPIRDKGNPSSLLRTLNPIPDGYVVWKQYVDTPPFTYERVVHNALAYITRYNKYQEAISPVSVWIIDKRGAENIVRLVQNKIKSNKISIHRATTHIKRITALCNKLGVSLEPLYQTLKEKSNA